MSHCTRFDFCYTNEEVIVRAFARMGLTPSTDVVGLFNSEISKRVLGRLGHMGAQQYRAICASSGHYQLFACKVETDHYELMIERGYTTSGDEMHMRKLAEDFQRAYIGEAIDDTVRRIESTNVPARARQTDAGYEIDFGADYGYTIKVTLVGGQINEEVVGVRGDVCAKITQQLEDILSHPSAELKTVWKPEYSVTTEEQTLQVLSINL
jgi:hypothetical protein